MKIWLKKGLLVWMVIALVVSTLPAFEPRAEEVKGDVVPTPKTTVQAKPVELVEERTENEIVYDNQNGTFTKQIFTEPVNVKEDGEWERVSNDLVTTEDNVIEAERTEIKASFLPKMEDGKYSVFGEGNEAIAFRFESAEGEKELTAVKDVESSVDGNEVRFKDVLPNTDLRNLHFNTSVKEDIVVNEYNGFNMYNFRLDTKLKVEQLEDGSITFTNRKGKVVFELPKPVMSDSNVDEKSGIAASSDAVEFKLEALTSTAYALQVVADADWLKAEDREYPVYIDPSVQLKKVTDAHIASAYPTTNYSGSKLWDAGQGEYTLSVGQYDGTTGINYAYIKPDVSSLAKASIESATFKAYATWHYYPSTPNLVKLDEVKGTWTPGAITWNNKPTATNIAQTNVGRDQWASFNVKDTVQAWAQGTRVNYGFMMHTTNTQGFWKKFTATETGKNVPYLEVTYSYAQPAKATVKTTSNGPGTGTGYMDLTWNAVPGATGYKVVISNGYNYQQFPVGNVTSWTSKGKKMFPTQAELDEGEFDFHTDGKGVEFANDPRELYENGFQYGSTFGLRNQLKYIVRIVATFPGGDSPTSDITDVYMPIETPAAPTGKAYANLAGTNTGYVQVNWAPVANAEGYIVTMFDGKKDVEFDVGNKTTWTTQNKGLWPTNAEIAAGGWELHTDGKGAELAQDPSPVYKNSGGTLGHLKTYAFRVKAYTKTGKQAASAISGIYKPTIPQVGSQQGMVDYWTSIPVIGGEVNATNGNFLFSETDFELEGRGPSINISRTFNSQNDQVGLFGKGWTSTLETRVAEQPNGDVILFESDNKTQLFTKNDTKYEAPAGVYSELSKTANGFLLVEQDKSEVAFNAAGQLLSEKDQNGNTLTYTYTSGKLTSMKDASGRTVSFGYASGGAQITKVSGPESRDVTFSYDAQKQLMMSTTPRGKQYRYGYTDGLLTAIYDPKHTDEKPYKTAYEYTDKKLVKVTDPVGKATTLSYAPEKREATLVNEKGKKTVYTYNQAGNPEKVIVDADGLKLTTTTSYEANNLIKEVSPKGQEETYTYDADGNVTSVTDPYGTENYTYNENNDVISATDTENRETTTAYSGADAVSETIQTEANMSSVTQYDAYGNPISGSGDLSAAGNLLLNNGFEGGATLPNWKMLQSNTTGGLSFDSSEKGPGSLGGSGALKISSEGASTEKGYTAATQYVDVEPNTTYTLSATIKTANMTNSDAFLMARLQTAASKDVTDGNVWNSNRAATMQGNRNWLKRQMTFTTTKETNKVLIYLMSEQMAGAKGKGTVWYDNVQLEKGSTASSYNPLVNNSVENSTELTADGWVRAGNTSLTAMRITDTEAFSGDSSVQHERKATTEENAFLRQTVTLNQTTAKAVTITSMSKSENAKASGTSKLSDDYALWADVRYTDGTNEYVRARFPLGTNDWNRSAVVVKPTKPIQTIRVSTMFQNSATGKAWFDDVRILDGEVMTKNTYDSNGNYVVASYDEENRKTAFTYDVYGNKLTETDEKGNTKKLEYNADNQLTKTTLANGTAVAYKYDDNGNTTEKFVTADGKEQQNSYAYDSDNKVTQFTDALGRKISYEYDANANQTKVTKPNDDTIESIYDSADRATGVKWNGQTAFSFQFDPNGNETKVTDVATGVVRDKAYDDADRITKQTERGGSVSWTYKDKPSKDNKGKTDKINEVIVSQGAHNYKATYDYNALDQNTKFSDGSRNYYLDYDEFGNVSHYINGNGVGTNFNYDATQKVREIQIGSKLGDSIFEESYTYDAASNRTAIDNKKAGKTSYEYDAINQLTKETLPDGTVKTYTYDGFGNRTKVTDSSKTKAIDASYNDGNQLTTWNGDKLTYDTNGNRLSDDTYTYTWNVMDQLTAITKKGETTPFATYKYDDDNRRLEKTVNGQTTRYYYDGDSIDVLYETDGAGTVQRQYVYSDSNIRTAMKIGAKTVFYHYNAHGDVIALTNEAGDIVAEYSYDAWGNVLKATETTNEAKQNPYGYAGYTYDKEISMYYLMARYYNPEQGVFITIDPDPGDDDDPIMMNGYNYVSNNPVMHVDPDGHVFWLAINAGFAAHDMYKAHKKGKSWKGVAAAGAIGFIGGSRFKLAKKAVDGARFVVGARAGKHSVYTLNHKVSGKVLYVGRTKNVKARKYIHSKVHRDAEMRIRRSGLSYQQARGLEHRTYLANGGKANLRNKIRPIAKKNKKYKMYMKVSRKYWR
ncbi:DNRLRE domain-containing protein [Listeria booriae]|uniref:RHS repeat-associated core domain-containing protein n=1 Tax=Listeria booriae TaxID=1552123 RepID=A0A7X1CY99_9LIST|nr:DNRLRE domain-containing protein [Listeria booriae]MBC2116167.1 RHS repeat-associated core domain-containing protein [Listeria booriae]